MTSVLIESKADFRDKHTFRDGWYKAMYQTAEDKWEVHIYPDGHSFDQDVSGVFYDLTKAKEHYDAYKG